MLALGVLITQANSPLRKWAVTGLLVVLAAAAYSGIPRLTGWLGPPSTSNPTACVDALFFVALGLMIWVERIPVPRLLHRPLAVIASSTLFIYIVNSAVISHMMPKLHLPAWWPLELTIAVGCGIMAQLIWTRCMGILWHLAERISGGQAGAPSRPQPSGLD
jgi:surface polysaccharide O-acyltransferase-like enzyme